MDPHMPRAWRQACTGLGFVLAPTYSSSARACVSMESTCSTRGAQHPFCTPYESLRVRSWEPGDRAAAAQVIGDALAEYGLGWEPDGADSDAVRIEDAYADERSEFWVVEDDGGAIVGTAALRPANRSPHNTAELRKMYIHKNARGYGLGSFLLAALEERARQLGYTIAFVETASVLAEAVELYKRSGYSSVSGIDTTRCDMALSKPLLSSTGSTNEQDDAPDAEHVIIVDHHGHSVAHVPRAKARKRRLLYLGIVVMVLSHDGAQVLVQKRSLAKANYPGAYDVFVAGAVQPGESPVGTAHRELAEELGLRDADFDWHPLWNGIHVVDTGSGDRCAFYGFLARAKHEISTKDVRFVDGEVDEALFVSRDALAELDLPSPVWAFVQKAEARGDLTCPTVPFFRSRAGHR